MIIIDEAAYIDPQVFYEVLVPLMEVEGTATICISSPQGKHNFYTQLANAVDDRGNQIFKVFRTSGNRQPPWKSKNSRGRVKALYGANQEAMYTREILGQVADDTENMAFNDAHLQRFFAHAPVAGPFEITNDAVYVSLDPNMGIGGGGVAVSDTAIVSFIVSAGCLIVVGLEYAPTPGHKDTKHLLYRHCAALRQRREFARSDIVLILEANNGKENDACAKYMLRRDERVKVMCERKHNYGVYTVPHRPAQYVEVLQQRLAVDGLRYHNDMVCVSRRLAASETEKQAVARCRAELERQLQAFRVLLQASKSFSSQISLRYTGKADKNGNRSMHFKDDMAMALMMGNFFYLRAAAEVPLVHLVTPATAFVTDPNEEAELEPVPLSKVARVN